jgi:hypothetical protein
VFTRKRPDPGRKVDEEAFISMEGEFAAVKCRVRHLSRDGAKLNYESPRELASHFRLKIASAGITRRCAVVARKGAQVEVVFLN